MEQKGKFLGYMLIAINAQNQIIASSWDDVDAKKWNRKAVLKWLRRGLTVRRIERYEADPMPTEWFSGTPISEEIVSDDKHIRQHDLCPMPLYSASEILRGYKQTGEA